MSDTEQSETEYNAQQRYAEQIKAQLKRAYYNGLDHKGWSSHEEADAIRKIENSSGQPIHPVDEDIHKRLVEISSSYGGYIRGDKGDMWPKMFKTIENYFATHLQAAVREAEHNIAKRIDELATDLGIPSLTTWQQGKFIDSLKYEHMGEKWKYEQQEREETSIRPYGGTNNALFRVANSVSAAEVAEYLQAVADYLQQLKKRPENV